MMHGHEKSDLAIVAEKPANKAEQPTAEASTGASAAEPVERRAGTKGNAGQQSTCRAQNRISVSQALERIRQFAVTPEVGAVCGKAARTVLCGGRAMKRTSLPLQFTSARPAQAGTQGSMCSPSHFWIPACAGMSGVGDAGDRATRGNHPEIHHIKESNCCSGRSFARFMSSNASIELPDVACASASLLE